MPTKLSIPQAVTAEAKSYFALGAILGGQIEQGLDQLNREALWATALPMAGNAMVVSSIAWQLRNALASIPADAADYLRAVSTLNTERNQHIIQYCCDIILALNGAGIVPILLKGGSLLLNARYADPSIRMQTDIDLLIPEQQLAIAADVLLALGFQFAKQQKRILIPTKKPVLKRYAKHLHLPPMINPRAPCSVELHRHCVSRRFYAEFPIDDLFAKAQAHQTQNASYLSFDDTLQSRHFVYHDFIGGGHFARKSLPLRLAMDLDCLKATTNDPKVRLAAACSHHLLHGTPFESTEHERFFRQLLAIMNNNRAEQRRAKVADTTNRLINLVHNPGKIWQLFNY